MRITIIGNAGSGKTTLARQHVARYDLAMLDLDTVAWESDRVAVPRPQGAAVADVVTFCEAHDHWVVEGCYAGLAAATLPYLPTLLFLDPGVDVCLSNCRNRPWEPHKYASKAEQDERLDFLRGWVQEYYSRDDDFSHAAHQRLFDRYSGPKQRLIEPSDSAFLPPAQPTFTTDQTDSH